MCGRGTRPCLKACYNPTMTSRPYNFSSGPAALPVPVLERLAEGIKHLTPPSTWRDDRPLEERLSVAEISHRSKTSMAIHEQAIERAHRVLGIPSSHRVLLLQGGATLQFAAIPLNLRLAGKPMMYVDTGVWSEKAIREASLLGPVEVIASSKATGFDHIPAMPAADRYAGASYVHITTNNTIYGTEFAELPVLDAEVPLCADLSSNIGSRPMDLGRLGVGYAGAQKNLGISGLTFVFVDQDLLQRELIGYVPTLLQWRTHAEKNSLLNTSNTLGIYALDLMLEWLEEQGGVEAMGDVNARKARRLYEVLDRSALYETHVQTPSRSRMNVTWTLAGSDEEERSVRTQRFLAQAQSAGLSGLKGHRLVGGIRASLYNAMPEAGVDALIAFMTEFERTQA